MGAVGLGCPDFFQLRSQPSAYATAVLEQGIPLKKVSLRIRRIFEGAVKML
jgi:hypothetical protein